MYVCIYVNRPLFLFFLFCVRVLQWEHNNNKQQAHSFVNNKWTNRTLHGQYPSTPLSLLPHLPFPLLVLLLILSVSLIFVYHSNAFRIGQGAKMMQPPLHKKGETRGWSVMSAGRSEREKDTEQKARAKVREHRLSIGLDE